MMAIRDGKERALDPEEIVVGDVLVAGPGDQIVADGRLIGVGRIEVDESLLTGEADPVPKSPGDALWSGSFVVAGRGYYEVEKVGAETVAYRLSVGARAFRRVQTPLQREVRRLVRIILAVAALLGELVAASGFIHDIPTVEMAQRAVLVLGLVPNGLFLAVAVAYALGAVRLAGRGVLVQQANAIKSLSNVDVLCLDKTGMLTSNRLSVQAVIPFGISEAELKTALGDYAASATAGNWTTEAIRSAWGGRRQCVRAEVPFSSQRKWSALTLDSPAGACTWVLGAPEVIFPRLWPPPGLTSQVGALSNRGLRLVLFATAPAQTPFTTPLVSRDCPTSWPRSGSLGSPTRSGRTRRTPWPVSPGPGSN
jgi:cation-transporting ATPase E